MSTEEELRAELETIRAQQRALAERAGRITDMLEGPRVTPLLCFWRHHRYFEDESYTDDVDASFRMLEAMEEEGTASTVGVRVGGCLITHADRGDGRSWLDDDKERAEAEKRHRELVLEELAEAAS